MYATVRSYPGGSALADALVENEADVRSLMTEISGFTSYHMIRTADGGAMSISVFADKAGADESTRVAREWVAANASHLSLASPQVTEGEVVMSA